MPAFQSRVFQFQTGAIKSRNAGHTGKRPAGMFQFQTGAIKSRHIFAERRFHRVCFNSKLVRLKVTYPRRRNAPNAVSIPNWCD